MMQEALTASICGTVTNLNEQAVSLIENEHYDAALELLDFAMNSLERQQRQMIDHTTASMTTDDEEEEDLHDHHVRELDEMRTILLYNTALSFHLKAHSIAQMNDAPPLDGFSQTIDHSVRLQSQWLQQALRMYQSCRRGIVLLRGSLGGESWEEEDEDEEDSHSARHHYDMQLSAVETNSDLIRNQLKLLEETTRTNTRV